jgi:hypothetical protein
MIIVVYELIYLKEIDVRTLSTTTTDNVDSRSIELLVERIGDRNCESVRYVYDVRLDTDWTHYGRN